MFYISALTFTFTLQDNNKKTHWSKIERLKDIKIEAEIVFWTEITVIWEAVPCGTITERVLRRGRRR